MPHLTPSSYSSKSKPTKTIQPDRQTDRQLKKIEIKTDIERGKKNMGEFYPSRFVCDSPLATIPFSIQFRKREFLSIKIVLVLVTIHIEKEIAK